MPNFEIELKSLLQTEENTKKILETLRHFDPDLKLVTKNNQLNHYFIDGDINRLSVLIHGYLDETQAQEFHQIVNNGSNFSIRSRQLNDQIILVIKASLDNDSSSNGTMRIEFEKSFTDLSLAYLDQILLDSGYVTQAKWSRNREEYNFKIPISFRSEANLNPTPQNITICIDKNAGYGYLAEFELIINDKSQAESGQKFLRDLIEFIGIQELSQDRLERMFGFYNQHWMDYYGTDKIFIVE
jgi:adenylate cyclase class IV